MNSMSQLLLLLLLLLCVPTLADECDVDGLCGTDTLQQQAKQEEGDGGRHDTRCDGQEDADSRKTVIVVVERGREDEAMQRIREALSSPPNAHTTRSPGIGAKLVSASAFVCRSVVMILGTVVRAVLGLDARGVAIICMLVAAASVATAVVALCIAARAEGRTATEIRDQRRPHPTTYDTPDIARL